MPSDHTATETSAPQDGSSETHDSASYTDQSPTATVQEYAERIRREELAEAIDRLEAHGELTAAQREAVEEMTVGIVNGVLAGQTAAPESVPDRDVALRRTVRRLFTEGTGDEQS